MNDDFHKADQAFAEYKQEHPDADYSIWYTKRLSEKTSEGQEHNSLGRNIVTKGEADFWEAGRRQAERFIAHGRVGPDQRVVEYGCGSLRLAVHFMAYLQPGAFMGLDIIPDFYEQGVENAGAEFIADRAPVLATIDGAGLEQAVGFGPDFVFAHSVVIHVHPEILGEFFANLERITTKPGARLSFNAMTYEEPIRYGNLGWAWPEDEMVARLPELELVDVARSGKTHVKAGYEVRGATFNFRRPA